MFSPMGNGVSGVPVPCTLKGLGGVGGETGVTSYLSLLD